MKKIIFIILILFLGISILSINTTLSYYVDEANKTSNFEIADWVIKVNKSDITLESSNEFTIDDINLIIPNSSVEGLKVSNEKFAPGTSGNFNILLDLSNVDTSINYDLSIDTSFFDNSNISIDSVSVGEEMLELVDGFYSNSLTVNKIKEQRQELITINFKWIDSDDNNDMDFGSVANSELVIPINIVIEQVVE